MTSSTSELRRLAVDNVISIRDLQAAGVARSTVAGRCQLGGPWRRILPGAVLLADAEPTRKQLLRAAVCLLGPDAVLTGADALRAHGVRAAPQPRVQVLVPADQRVQATERTAPERTSRLPDPVWLGGLAFAPLARATIDAARHEQRRARLRALLRAALRIGTCTIEGLRAELDAGNQRGTAAIRHELRRLGDGRAIADYDTARELLRGSPIPTPRWHVTVHDRRGRAIDAVDGWWDELAVGWQFGGEHFDTGKLCHLNLTGAGVALVRTPTDRLHADPTAVRRELAAAIRQAAGRPRPDLHCRDRPA